MESLSQIAQNIKDKDFFCILTHNYPDGDAVGSAVALCLALQKLGKFAKVEFGANVPEKFSFLRSYIKNQDFEPKNYISVDLADTNLLHESLKFLSEKIDICIDHHKSNKKYAKINFVDSFASANCEVLFELFEELGCIIDENIAKCLYVGIATDTGGFMYSNVRSQTHAIVSELLKRNIDVGKINEQIFVLEPKKKFELKKLICNNLSFYFGDKVAISYITLKEMSEIGILDSELDGIASIPVKIENVEIGVTIREKVDGFCKVSVRTRDIIDANEFCAIFDGGGHERAGGFNVPGDTSDAQKSIIEAIKKFTGWRE